MVIASKVDIRKRTSKEQAFLKKLDSTGRATEKSLVSAVRGAIRKTWMKHPTKLAFLMKYTYADLDPTTRTKWLVDCMQCKSAFKQTEVEIDHIKGNHACSQLKDIVEYAKTILHVGFNDLQILCKECHSIKTYSDKMGISFEDSEKEKKIIAKTLQTVTKQKEELTKAGFTPSEISNNTKRRDCYRKLLK